MDELDAVQCFAALGQPTRLKIAILLSRYQTGLPVNEIAATLRVRQSTLSSHLKIMATADLVVAHRSGRIIIYRLSGRHISRLANFIVRSLVPE
jgi:ArsR family transcriptional regulator